MDFVLSWSLQLLQTCSTCFSFIQGNMICVQQYPWLIFYPLIKTGWNLHLSLSPSLLLSLMVILCLWKVTRHLLLLWKDSLRFLICMVCLNSNPTPALLGPTGILHQRFLYNIDLLGLAGILHQRFLYNTELLGPAGLLHQSLLLRGSEYWAQQGYFTSINYITLIYWAQQGYLSEFTI